MPDTTLLPDDALLTANLTALEARQPALVERLHWPVEGDALSHDADGRWTFRLHRSEYVATLTEQETLDALPRTLGADVTGTQLVFGLGLGETLAATLERAPRANVIAWERDPWVLRQALSVRDWTADIASGRLRFALNADLVDLLEGGIDESVVWHPLLSRAYTNERWLVTEGLGERRALVCCGGLFVDALASALRDEGYSVLSFDVEKIAAEESELVLETFQPSLVASINSIHGLADFCQARELDHLCWEVDPATDAPAPLAAPAPRAHVFTFREANVAAYRSAGYEDVRYLPLAADPGRRRPVELSALDRDRYGAEVAFVGSSLTGNVSAFQELFLTQLESWTPGSRSMGRDLIREVVTAQRKDVTRFLVPQLLEERVPGFRAHSRTAGLQDPAMLLGEVCAAEKRLNLLAELGDHDVAVWGDEGFLQLESHGVRHEGAAGHGEELTRIYNAAAIHLDIGRLYQPDIVTMRVFDVLACGGFVIAERSEALEELFQLGVEVESYQDLTELQTKIEYYLARPDEARTIAERGRQAVLERHTIAQRLRTMLASFAPAENAAAPTASAA